MKHAITLIVILLLILLITQARGLFGQNRHQPIGDGKRPDRLLPLRLFHHGSRGRWQGQLRTLRSPLVALARQKTKRNHCPGNQELAMGSICIQTTCCTIRQRKEISTDAEVFITSPSGTMQSTGLTAKLDQDLLRFDSNVRSTYQVK